MATWCCCSSFRTKGSFCGNQGYLGFPFLSSIFDYTSRLISTDTLIGATPFLFLFLYGWSQRRRAEMARRPYTLDFVFRSMSPGELYNLQLEGVRGILESNVKA